jgi:hypothetical protein
MPCPWHGDKVLTILGFAKDDVVVPLGIEDRTIRKLVRKIVDKISINEYLHQLICITNTHDVSVADNCDPG